MNSAKRLLALLALRPISSLTKFSYCNTLHSSLSLSFSSNNMASDITTDITLSIAAILDKNVFNNDINLIENRSKN